MVLNVMNIPINRDEGMEDGADEKDDVSGGYQPEPACRQPCKGDSPLCTVKRFRDKLHQCPCHNRATEALLVHLARKTMQLVRNCSAPATRVVSHTGNEGM